MLSNYFWATEHPNSVNVCSPFNANQFFSRRWSIYSACEQTNVRFELPIHLSSKSKSISSSLSVFCYIIYILKSLIGYTGDEDGIIVHPSPSTTPPPYAQFVTVQNPSNVYLLLLIVNRLMSILLCLSLFPCRSLWQFSNIEDEGKNRQHL